MPRWFDFAASVFGAALDLILPRACSGCGRGIRSGWWCPDCESALPRIRPPRCEICSQPFDGVDAGPFRCPNCGGKSFHFGVAVSSVLSRGPVRDLIHALKYGGATWAVGPLAEFGLEALGDSRLSPPYDALVPVPLHPVRRRARGYNQSELLARAVASPQKTPVLRALERRRDTATQTHFDRKERMQNLRGAFAPSKNTDIDGMSILIIDDVLTTGSTLDECARALLGAGAARVDALTIARG